MQRFFIIDAMAMIFRTYHAFGQRPLLTSKGMPTSAIFGSAMFLLKLLEEEKPDLWCAATDTKEPTFRHKRYSEYKANRTAMPEDLSIQIPYIYRLFNALGLHVITKPGYEADDIIATLVSKYKSSPTQFLIVSGDKDLMQLVDAKTNLYAPKKGEQALIIDTKAVHEKFGCAPDAVRDVLAIIGDTSDNVPGVHGIGEKGAAKLIGQYKNLEGVYAHLDEIKNEKQRKSLIESKEQAFLSRELVTLDHNVPIDVELSEFQSRSKSASKQALIDLFSELEFRTLVERIQAWPDDSAPNTAKPLNSSPENPEPPATAYHPDHAKQKYQRIESKKQFENLLEKIRTAEHFAIDTETTGLDKINDKPIGISFCFKPGEAFYLPVHAKHAAPECDPVPCIAALAQALHTAKALKIAHNIKFDLQMLHNIDIKLSGPYADTMLMAYLLNPIGREYSLDECTLRELNYKKIPTTDLIGKDAEVSMLDVDIALLTRYACEDVDYTLRLFTHYLKELQSQELLAVHNEIEAPLCPILANMEQAGVFVDTEQLANMSKQLSQRAESLSAEIFKEAGEEFNINSTKQLGAILFEKLKVHEQLGIKKIKKTKSGYSTDVSVLEKLSAHPLPKSILEYRTVVKLKNTYVDALPELINPTSHRIHTNFHQAVTATGRLSSSDPNLQNIPIRSDFGREIRRAFRAESKSDCIISADYSQVELRILAHLTGDAALVEAFSQNLDIHTDTAARVFGLSPAKVTPELRAQAKAINFGIIYGMGPQRLARDTGLSMDEAKQFIERYFKTYPGIESYIDESIQFARKHGYSRTMTGRRRPIPELKSKEPQIVAFGENVAVNSPVQGSAADLIKLAMIAIDHSHDFKATQARMLLQVHDELVFECAKSHVKQAVEAIRYCMEHAMDLRVPIKVEVGHGRDWLEAHE